MNGIKIKKEETKEKRKEKKRKEFKEKKKKNNFIIERRRRTGGHASASLPLLTTGQRASGIQMPSDPAPANFVDPHRFGEDMVLELADGNGHSYHQAPAVTFSPSRR